MSAFVVPKDPVDAYNRCIETLMRLHSFAVEVVEDIRATRDRDLMTRKQSSEFNRACQMARHASECLIASRWNVHGRSMQKRKVKSLGIDPELWSAPAKKGSPRRR